MPFASFADPVCVLPSPSLSLALCSLGGTTLRERTPRTPSLAPPAAAFLPLPFAVMDLLMWKDVTKSGIAFGTATFLYLLFELSGWTTVAILANAALLAIIGTFVWSTVSQVLGKSALPIPEPNPEAVDKFFVQVCDQGKTFTNEAVGTLYRLAKGQEPALSIKAAFVCYIVAKIGGLFNLLTLAYIIVFSLFTMPKVYDMYKEEIDKFVQMGHAKVQELTAQGKKLLDDKVLSKINLPAKKTE